MSYFPSDIPYMADAELEKYGIKAKREREMSNKLDAYTEYVMDSIVEDIREYLCKDDQIASTIFPEFLGVHNPHLISKIIKTYSGVVIFSRIDAYKKAKVEKQIREKNKKIEEAKAFLEKEGYAITKANGEEEETK